jgi:hypothetical protein
VAGIERDPSQYSKWVNEADGRQGALVKAEVQKLLEAVRTMERKDEKRMRSLDSTSVDWLMKGDLPSAPFLLADDEGFRFSWHLQALSFCMAMACVANERGQADYSAVASGIPDKDFDVSKHLRSLNFDAHSPSVEDKNFSGIAAGYMSLADRLWGEKASNGTPAIALAWGLVNAARRGIQTADGDDMPLSDLFIEFGKAWGVRVTYIKSGVEGRYIEQLDQ